MSVELIALMTSTATLLIGFVSVIGWLVALIGGVERELVEVKIAIARLDGLPRHLVTAL